MPNYLQKLKVEMSFPLSLYPKINGRESMKLIMVFWMMILLSSSVLAECEDHSGSYKGIEQSGDEYIITFDQENCQQIKVTDSRWPQGKDEFTYILNQQKHKAIDHKHFRHYTGTIYSDYFLIEGKTKQGIEVEVTYTPNDQGILSVTIFTHIPRLIRPFFKGETIEQQLFKKN